MYPDVIIKHFQFEAEAWQRELIFFQQENALLKSRLADIVNRRSDESSIIMAETFNEQFIAQDTVFSFLFRELAELNQILEKELFGDGLLFGDLVARQDKLRKDFYRTELLFYELKHEFGDFISASAMEVLH
jgi:hypothetical protein